MMKMNGKRLVALLAVALLLVMSCVGSVAETVTLADAVTTFENGCMAEKNDMTVVDLHGTWHEMGRQYGALLQRQLREVADLCEEVISASEDNQTSARKTLQTQHDQMPYTIRCFFDGMEETSGLTRDELERANAVERIAGLPHCSFAAVWDDYAAGDLVLGRNYDYAEIFHRLNRDVVITVFHPADDALATAIIGYAGEIYAVNGLNEAGIFMELNNGTFSARLKAPDLRITGTTQLMDMLFEADSLDMLDLYFNSSLNSSAYIINAADSNTVRSYEWCTLGVKRGDGSDPDGVFASTNHYLSPDWEFEAPDEAASLQTTARRNGLLALCEANKGRIDVPEMMEIIDTTTENGGAKNPLTVYQLVVTPVSRTVWMKTATQTEWTEFDLASFLEQ